MHVYCRFSRGLSSGAGAVARCGRPGVLIKHTYTAGWQLAGGGVEAGEDAAEALARELREEGNIELTGPPTLHGVFFHPRYSVRDTSRSMWSGNSGSPTPPVPNNEIAEHGFIALDALPHDTTSGTRRGLAEALHGQPLTERW